MKLCVCFQLLYIYLPPVMSLPVSDLHAHALTAYMNFNPTGQHTTEEVIKLSSEIKV